MMAKSHGPKSAGSRRLAVAPEPATPEVAPAEQMLSREKSADLREQVVQLREASVDVHEGSVRVREHVVRGREASVHKRERVAAIGAKPAVTAERAVQAREASAELHEAANEARAASTDLHEGALEVREDTVNERETAVKEREGEALSREVSTEVRASEVAEREDLDRINVHLREVNEQLVRASDRLAASTAQEQARQKDLRVANETLSSKALGLARRNAELVEIRCALEQKAKELHDASTFKSQFLANMSHELRTPLNAIIGFAQLLRDGDVPEDAPEHHEFLGDILTGGRQLLRLINDVLDLAKIEAGKIEVRPDNVDLRALVAQVVAAMSPLTVEKQIAIDLEISPLPDLLFTDSGRLTQVLYNYLSNAVKFSPRGSRVCLRIQPEGADAVRFEVEDHGGGIAPEDLPKLFQPFGQLAAGKAPEHQGSGLGLALTKRLVELLGGTVGVTSTRGAGSLFHATLPRHPGIAGAASAGDFAANPADTSAKPAGTSATPADTSGTPAETGAPVAPPAAIAGP
jgi:signal transduction histidine kinase